MQHAQDEFDPPYEILEPAEGRGPVVFNSPHSGSVYPREFLLTSRLDLATLRRSASMAMMPIALRTSAFISRSL